MKKKIEFKKTMTIDEVLTQDPNCESVLLGFGLHCLGCPCSRSETLEQASMVHGFDVELLVKKLNEKVAGN